MESHKDDPIRWFKCVAKSRNRDCAVILGKLYPATTVDEDGDLTIVDENGDVEWVSITESWKWNRLRARDKVRAIFEEVFPDENT